MLPLGSDSIMVRLELLEDHLFGIHTKFGLHGVRFALLNRGLEMAKKEAVGFRGLFYNFLVTGTSIEVRPRSRYF